MTDAWPAKSNKLAQTITQQMTEPYWIMDVLFLQSPRKYCNTTDGYIAIDKGIAKEK